MAQLDVFDNPITRARRDVVILQSDIADSGNERIVAPLVPRSKLGGTVGRLTPHVKVDGTDHVVLVPSLTSVRMIDLSHGRGSLRSYRDEIVAALDFLFLGV